jgi:hypothetical protein
MTEIQAGDFTIGAPPNDVTIVAVDSPLVVGGPYVQLTFVGDDPDVVSDLEGNSITFNRPGRYLVLAGVGVAQTRITVVAYDPELISRINVRTDNPVLAPDAARRRVLREMAKLEPNFDGTLETFLNFNPRNYGAAQPGTVNCTNG